MITTNAMMRHILKIGLAILVAARVAYWSVDWALRRPSERLRNGPWKTDLNVGSAAADIYQRARTAKAREFDFVIVRSGSKYRGSDSEQVVFSPTSKVVMIVRMIVTDRNDKEELARISEVQKKTYIESIAATGY